MGIRFLEKLGESAEDGGNEDFVVSPEAKEIIEYIAGAVLFKLKERYSRSIKKKTSAHNKDYTAVLLKSDIYESSSMELKQVMQHAFKLFYKIIKHHECELFMEKYKIKKKCVGKGKALRVKLADKNAL